MQTFYDITHNQKIQIQNILFDVNLVKLYAFVVMQNYNLKRELFFAEGV